MNNIYIIILVLSFGFSNRIFIPDDFLTIQDAINEANHLDTIIVNQGIYYESLNINSTWESIKVGYTVTVAIEEQIIP